MESNNESNKRQEAQPAKRQMRYHKVECPTCGNTTMAMEVRRPQKCELCRQMYKLVITQHGRKRYYSAEYTTFPTDKTVGGYHNGYAD